MFKVRRATYCTSIQKIRLWAFIKETIRFNSCRRWRNKIHKSNFNINSIKNVKCVTFWRIKSTPPKFYIINLYHFLCVFSVFWSVWNYLCLRFSFLKSNLNQNNSNILQSDSQKSQSLKKLSSAQPNAITIESILTKLR